MDVTCETQDHVVRYAFRRPHVKSWDAMQDVTHPLSACMGKVCTHNGCLPDLINRCALSGPSFSVRVA